MLFDEVAPKPQTPSSSQGSSVDGDDEHALDKAIFHPMVNQAKDIALVQNHGLGVDDDNEPALENISENNQVPITTNLYPGQTWGWDGIDQQELVIQTKKDASFQNDWSPHGKLWVDIVFKLFPAAWLFDCCMKATSTAIVYIGNQALNQGELIWYLGLWLLMVTCSGWSKADFWDKKPYNPRSNPCPYQFSLLMNKTRFDEITSELRFTNQAPPTYHDCFWEVREMVREWNKNMWAFFIQTWMICLDESMSIWFQRWTCPGWVFCPRKPHPFGNEYHTACCLFSLELVEGKDRPAQLGPPEYDDLGGKTTDSLLRVICFLFKLLCHSRQQVPCAASVD